jgi:hypothetical protein
MRNLLVLPFLLAGLAQAEEAAIVARPMNLVEPARALQPVAGKALWQASLATLAVANAMDIHSSWGKYELNPLLSGTNQKFGRDGALLKMAFQGGLMGAEYLITRGHSSGRLYRTLSFINFGAAGVIGSTAAHNYSITR